MIAHLSCNNHPSLYCELHVAVMNPLAPPNIDIRHVSMYNNHGKALVELLESTSISSLHCPFILGIFAVYTMLVSMQYMNDDDISWAPHSNFIAEEWLAIGSAQEVVDILALLPTPAQNWMDGI
jgi:hypothetical protein